MEATNTALTDNNIPQTPESENNAVTKKDNLKNRRNFVIVGVVLTLLGWVLMSFLPWIALAATVGGLVYSSLGVRIPPGPRRNIAITSIIASSVLILVFLTFFILLNVIV